MAPLTLCIPGITVWGPLPWSSGGGSLVGPQPQLSDTHHSPHPSCSSQSQICPASPPHPISSISPFLSLDGLPHPNPPHPTHPALLPKCSQRQKQNSPSGPSKPRWDRLGCTEKLQKHHAARHLPQTSGVLGLGRSPRAAAGMGSSQRSCPPGKDSDKVQALRAWVPAAAEQVGRDHSPVRPWQTLSLWTPNGSTTGRQGGWRGPKSLPPSHLPHGSTVGRGSLRAPHGLQAPSVRERHPRLSAQPAGILPALACSPSLLFVPPAGMGADRQRRTRALAAPGRSPAA